MRNPLFVTYQNIHEFRQNRADIICRDFKRIFNVPERLTARILMGRGVYKWLAARRDFIKLKNDIRDELTILYGEVGKLNGKEKYKMQGRIEALEDCRKEIRAICHSHRWRIPDNDKNSWKWLS
jgi:hypothetical protein